jgi:hypothetical protein
MKIGPWTNSKMLTDGLARFYLDEKGNETREATTVLEIPPAFHDDIVLHKMVVNRSVKGAYPDIAITVATNDQAFAKRLANSVLDFVLEEDGNGAWFLWKLAPFINWLSNPNHRLPYEERAVNGVVVVAQTEEAARITAQKNAGCEVAFAEDVWTDSGWTTCVRVGRSDEREEKVVLESSEVTPCFYPGRPG